MGTLRLLLAIVVLIGHANNNLFGFVSVKGVIAVQVFYVISGFYMTLILNEKYSDYKTFLTNRFLKIFPTYWIVLLLTIGVSILGYAIFGNGFVLQKIIENKDHLSLSTLLYLIVSNITISGQNLILYLTANSQGLLEFTSNFRAEKIPLYEYLFIPQAWTLCVEMSFYLIAPFLVKRNFKFVLGIIGISLLSRVILYTHGFNHDTFNYRFFPNELMFFLAGTLAYKFYTKIKTNELVKKYAIYFTVFLIGYVLVYQYIPTKDVDKKLFLYCSLVPLIPIVFVQCKKIKWDRFIGDLSYPVYISHFFIIEIFRLFENRSFIAQNFTLLTLLSTIVFSIILNKTIIQKVETYRQNRIKNNITERLNDDNFMHNERAGESAVSICERTSSLTKK